MQSFPTETHVADAHGRAVTAELAQGANHAAVTGVDPESPLAKGGFLAAQLCQMAGGGGTLACAA